MNHITASKFQALRQANKGAGMVFMGLCLLPFMLILGLIINSSVGLAHKGELQAAVDIATKAGVAR